MYKMIFHKSKAHKHIHRTLKKHSPGGVHKAQRLVAFKHLKFLVLVVSILLAYYIFSRPTILGLVLEFTKLGHIGMFAAGALFSFGVSAPFSIGFFLVAKPENIILATILAGLGGMAVDIFIFHVMKFSFRNEFEELKKKKIIRKIEKIVEKNKHVLIRHYLLYIFAGIMIATPLPDELAVSMLAGLTTIKPMKLAVISFVLHSLVVFLLLYFGAS